MGLLSLQRLMSLQRDRQRLRRQTPARSNFAPRSPSDGSIASVDTRNGTACQQDVDGNSQGSKTTTCSIPDLPEDIWRNIFSLMPLRDAARAACLSRAFLCSWRCHPNLTLNRNVLLSKDNLHVVNVSHIIDNIIRNHSGTGLKILKLQLYGIANNYCLDSWLQVAVTPTIEELTVVLCNIFKKKYNFPCSVLSNGVGNSIQYLELGFCAFRPTAELGPLRNLTSLNLRSVRVTGDELECFLSNSLALEQLDLSRCKEVICLKIPCVLQKFRCLRVIGCWRRLQEIESKAPNLSTLCFGGNVKLTLGGTLQVKRLSVSRQKVVYYARTELPSIMPNLETLDISSNNEVVNTPLLPTKFICLKHLSISITSGDSFSPSYDYVSLVSFLDASPFLETLILDVSQEIMEHKSVFGDSSGLRQMPEQRHCCLRSVKMTGFSSAKSLVQLTCYIVQNAVSLECLVLDTLYGFRCSDEDSRITRCYSMSKTVLQEATRAVAAVITYIEDKIPNTVKLTVVEPCTRCHAAGRW